MFTPSRITQEPVLPFADPTSVIVNAINENDYDVEFYSLDFNTQYKDEEKFFVSWTMTWDWSCKWRCNSERFE